MKKSSLIICLLSLGIYFQGLYGQTQLLQTSGKLSFLRVHNVGGQYGPPNDQIDVEVVIKFAGNTAKAYGFQLRNDANKFARQGMLDLLRDAFNYGHTVTVDYKIDPGKNNGEIIRVWLTRSSNSIANPANQVIRQNRIKN